MTPEERTVRAYALPQAEDNPGGRVTLTGDELVALCREIDRLRAAEAQRHGPGPRYRVAPEVKP